MIIPDTLADKTFRNREGRSGRLGKLGVLFSAWEFYLIVILSAFVHFYSISTAIFQYDESNVYRFSREAVTQGFIPITSNSSSIFNMNPPFMVYLGMISAIFSSDPIWAQVLVAFSNFLAGILTYLFVRRYYGRLAGGIAGLLYITAVVPLLYSRSFWPQNLLPLFSVVTMIFIFRGIYERRKGWLVPAALVIALAYQFHGTAVFLIIPLALAILFAWRTLRVRDFVWVGGGVLLLYSTYIYWLFKSDFSDIYIILHASKNPAVFSLEPIRLYLFFLSPYVKSIVRMDPLLPDDPNSLLVVTPLHYFALFLRAIRQVMPYLLLCGIVSAVIQILLPLRSGQRVSESRFMGGRFNGWIKYWSNPHKQGLVLLLSWQVVPLLFLLKSSIPLFPHYFIIFVPGQFILIALFFVSLVKMVQRYQPRWGVFIRSGICALALLLIAGQFLGSFTLLYDTAHGHFVPFFADNNFYGDVQSLQKVTSEADNLAQERHIGRIYISTDFTLSQSMNYSAEHMKTPTSVFENWQGCFVLPGQQAGPVVFLSVNSSPFDEGFMAAYANAELVKTLPRLSGAPFKLYILTAKAAPVPNVQAPSIGMALLSTSANVVSSVDGKQQWLTTRWSVMHTFRPSLRTTYHLDTHYQTDMPSAWTGSLRCSANTFWAGDQLLTYTSSANKDVLPTTLNVKADAFNDTPVEFKSLNLLFVSHKWQEGAHKDFRTMSGENTFKLPVSDPVG